MPTARKPSAKNLFSRRSYDPDATSYTSVPNTLPHSDYGSSDEDEIYHEGAASGSSETLALDREVLIEEEEREKLLARSGLLGSIGRKAGLGVKIGKRVKGGRRKLGDVVGMMGGKRLGMEEGGEFGLGESEDEEEEEAVNEKIGKPRSPSLRRMILYTAITLTVLLVVISATLMLTHFRPRSTPPKTILTNGTHTFHPTTLLLSIDGLRADFLFRNITPTLTSFLNSGVSPEYLIPAFPSVTFPNHWTLVTGLHPESHGIVGNSFFDPATQKEFYYTDPARSHDAIWWGGEPIWLTAEKQGVKAAVHMWPGSEAVHGWGSSFVDVFNSSEVLDRKVDRMLEWIDLPLEERPQLILGYIPNVDAVGHKFGPNTTETDAAVKEVDDMVRELLGGLEARNLSDIVNVVVVSDHGMAGTDVERMLWLEDIMDVAGIEHTDGWPLFGLRMKDGIDEMKVFQELKEKRAETENPHWEVYHRDVDMPERYHFSKNPRIAPVWIIPETGWAIVMEKDFSKKEKEDGVVYHPRGLHGYDNMHPLMRAVFLARGPRFAHLHGAGREWIGETEDVWAGRVEPFGNWEVYGIVADCLEISASPSNGTLGLEGLKLVEVPSELEDVESKPGVEAGTTTSEGAMNIQTVPPEPATTASGTEGVMGIQTAPAEPQSSKSIGVDHPTPPPSATTPTQAADAPESTETGTEDGAEEVEIDIDLMSWWEYTKWKSEKLKEALEKWWDGVWVDDQR
ncbi:hypothetical protein RUND412_003734 [Rhizina undulata]